MASQSDNVKLRMSLQAEARISQQKKAFLGWINAHLQQKKMRIEKLEDLSQVTPLIYLLEILHKKPINKITKNHKEPRSKFDKLEGMRICLNHIKSREGNKSVPFDAQTLIDGTEIKIFLALVWRTIVTFGMDQNRAEPINDDIKNSENDEIKSSANEDESTENSVPKQEPQKPKKRPVQSPEQRLRKWVNSRLSNELQIGNFTTKWTDGKALICLMNQALAKPDHITAESIENMDNKQLLDNILQINDTHLNIPQLLDSKDLMSAPNKEAVMTYVLLLKAAIENREAELKEEQQRKLKEERERNAQILIEAKQNDDTAPDMFDGNDKNQPEMDTEIQEQKAETIPEKSQKKDGEMDDSYLTPGINGISTADGIESEDESSDEDNSQNNLDLCILCDLTDGMRIWMDKIKTGIHNIISDLKKTYGIGKLRLAFVGYRDWDDDNNNKGEQRIEKLDFIKHVVYFESFVENVQPIGGGDAAEDVLGGIQEALTLKWKAPIRVLYHICDAPAHGTMYHDYFERFCDEQVLAEKKDKFSFLDGFSADESESDEKNSDEEELLMMEGEDEVLSPLDKEREAKLLRDEWDKWPNKHSQDPKHEDLIMELKQKNIQYFLGTQTSFTDKMVKVFREYGESIDYALKTMNLYNVSQFLPTLINAIKHAIEVVKPPEDSGVLKDIDINKFLSEFQKQRVSFQVHCGIDFGTAGSGFAYSLPGKNEVYTDQNWGGSGKHVDVKTKTNILLDTDGNCIAFGDDATDKYTHTDTNDLFFERFKMALYAEDNENMAENGDEKKSEMESKQNTYSKTDIREYLTATNGEQLPSRKVLEEALRFMKNHAMNNLRSKVNKDLKIENVQWILTVPAIWTDKAKSLMQTAAVKAGMIDPSIDGQLIIAYEPDCASLSIVHELNEKVRAVAMQQRSMRKHKENSGNIEDEMDEMEQKSYFSRGDKLLLCDLGGGTADIACHEIDENERIRQIVAPSGGAWGSTYVDQHFLQLLDDIFSKAWMDAFRKEESSKYIEFLQNFRESKKTYKMNDKQRIKKKAFDSSFHNIKVPFTFLDVMGERAEEMDKSVDESDSEGSDGDDLERIVENFTKFGKKGLVRLNDEYLELSYTVWNDLFDKVVDCIVSHCKFLLDLPEMNGCKYLCLVGGFSESKHLQTKMFKTFGTKSQYDIVIFTPARPILSVVDGAARMGLRPDFISARTIAKTYGIAIQKTLAQFKEIYPHSLWQKLIPKAKVSKKLTYSTHNKAVMVATEVVNDVFLPFVRRNELIKNNDKPIIYWVRPADIKANKISIRLYSDHRSDPIFVTDSEETDKIDIELSENYDYNNSPPIPIIFIFNDTTIRVFVTMGNETKEISVNFDVLR